MIFIAFLSGALPSFSQAYNEVFDSSGKLRPAYAAYVERTGRPIFSVSPQATSALTLHPMDDQIRILPLPMIIADKEYRRLQKGVRQRARALQMFFEDLVFNDRPKIYRAQLKLPAGLPPLTEEMIKAITETEGTHLKTVRELWRGKSRSDVNFTYGPDLVRNPEGQWRVLEDNIGPVGGMADMESVAALFDVHTEHSPTEDLTFPSDFEASLRNFLRQHHLDPAKNEVIALLKYDEKEKPDDRDVKIDYDREDERKAAVLKKMGISILDPYNVENGKKILEDPKIRGIFNFHPVADGYKNQLQYLNLFSRKNVAFYNSPFTEIISSKAYTPYMDAIVEFYTGERPILETQESIVIDGEKEVEQIQAILRGSPMERSQWVLKRIDESQGKGVYVLGKLNAKQLRNLEREIEEWASWRLLNSKSHSYFTLQKRVEVSFIPAESAESWLRFTMDLRPITYVLGDELSVSEQPWARSNFDLGANLNNVSQGAFEARVIREACETPLKKSRTRRPRTPSKRLDLTEKFAGQ